MECVEALYGPNSEEVLWSIYGLAWVLKSLEEYGSAKILTSRLIAICNKNFATDYDFNLRSMNLLASILADQNMYDEAEKIYREIIQISEGGGVYLSNFGSILHNANRFEESEVILRKA